MKRRLKIGAAYLAIVFSVALLATVTGFNPSDMLAGIAVILALEWLIK